MLRVKCPCCQTELLVKAETQAVEGPGTPARLKPRMDADFARWYLWARLMQETHPEDRDAGVLVSLLRRVDDLEERKRRDPEGTPANLVEALAESVVALVRRLLAAYPASNPPR